MIENIFRQFLEKHQEWEKIYKTGIQQLEQVTSYLESIQPTFQQTTTSIKELAESFPDTKLQSYISRGCKKQMRDFGRDDARKASEAYEALLQNQAALNRLETVLQEFVVKGLDSLLASSDSKKFWKTSLQKDHAVTNVILAPDLVLLMGMRADDLEQEQRLFNAVVDSVGVFSQVSELRSQLIVLKLRPYENESTIETLSSLKIS